MQRVDDDKSNVPHIHQLLPYVGIFWRDAVLTHHILDERHRATRVRHRNDKQITACPFSKVRPTDIGYTPVHTVGTILGPQEHHLAVVNDMPAQGCLLVHILIAARDLHRQVEQDKRFAQAAYRSNKPWDTPGQYVLDKPFLFGRFAAVSAHAPIGDAERTLFGWRTSAPSADRTLVVVRSWMHRLGRFFRAWFYTFENPKLVIPCAFQLVFSLVSKQINASTIGCQVTAPRSSLGLECRPGFFYQFFCSR